MFGLALPPPIAWTPGILRDPGLPVNCGGMEQIIAGAGLFRCYSAVRARFSLIHNSQTHSS